LAAIAAATATPRAPTSAAAASSLTSPHPSASRASTCRALKKSSYVRGAPTTSRNRRSPAAE